ncbi:tyrosine--tRNA ligase [Rubinisphaera sp.]|uniref:tyrosine--tRNA ligase n=1 Tax=Rubinisphaera sp. TaxID=2024857 RepID=UPI000C0F2FFE|nr:tyrosine--tRNA ligase [Rubinisphaera sp.]MBV07828.1 tyrosine--tRNA ligase [Rubinisphaera sp.]
MTFPPVEEQLEVIRRGVEKIVPEEELRKKLEKSAATGQPLRIKYGIDPTGIDLHLGHTVPMRKMRQFQQLGHQAVIIIGNYTALVGDPSGRDETRARLTSEQVEANAQDYLKQVAKVIDMDSAEVHRNGDWFAKMDFARILELCSKVTVAQLLTRDDFSKRFKNEHAIYLHECLYPLMQGWDSVEIKADIELGGTEQLYTFMLARDLQKDQGLPLQLSVMSPILVGTDGVRRMGKSLGNYIGISESAYDMTKKLMQLPDEVMQSYFELLTDLPIEEIQEILAGHPKIAKQTLARCIAGEYHSEQEANESVERWEREIGAGGLPSDIPEVTLEKASYPKGNVAAVDLLFDLKLVNTKSDGRRLIQQGGAKLGEEKTAIGDINQSIELVEGLIVWAGKKKFCRVKLQ